MRAHAVVLLFALSACGEVTGGIVDAAATIDAIDSPGSCSPACGANATCSGTTCTCNAGFTGDGITCTAIAHWQKIATVVVALDLGNNRGFEAIGLAPNIYFAPVSDPPQTTTFQAFNTTTLSLSGPLALPPGLQNDFEASGYGAIFVADRDFLYLIGDEAHRYDPLANRWTAVPGYGSGPFHRGESAGAWEGNNNTIFMIGGRDDATNQYQGTAIRRNADGTWAAEPGALPYTLRSGLAYAPPNDNQTYISGSAGDNNRRHLAVHASGTSSWTALADAPGDIDRPIGMGHYTVGGVTRVFVATQSEVFFYNPSSSAWDRRIDMPSIDAARVVMIAGIPHALARNGGSADVFKLVSIE